MRKPWWEEGDYNALCDGCGFKFKASELRERYDGMMVCSEDWEPRHPSERSLSIRSPKTLPWTRPESTDVYLDVNFCTVDGLNGTADHGTAGCAIVGRNTTQGQ